MNKEKLFHIYWGIAFCAVPLYLSTGKGADIRTSKDIFSVLLIAISYMAFGLTKKVSPYIKLLIISFVFMAFINKSFLQLGFFYHFAMILAFSLFSIQMISNSSKEYLHIFISSLFISGFIQSVFSIINKTGFSIYGSIFLTAPGFVNDGSTGTLGNQNILGSFIALTIPTLLNKKRIVFAPVFMAGLYFSQSQAPIISVIIGVGIYCIAIHRNMFARWCVGLGVVSLSLLTFTLPFYGAVFDGTGRLFVWAKMIKHMDLTSFIFGNGVGYLRNNYKLWEVMRGVYFYQAHNEYLELVFTLGIVGALLVFLFVKKLFPRKPILISILTIGLVNSFFHFEFHVSITALIMLAVLCFNDRSSNVAIME